LLILQWIKNPSEALGRLTSSPWPDHIGINNVKKITDNKYEVIGNIIEMTNVEVENGGYADKYGINLTVERIKGKWSIAEVIKEATSVNGPSSNQAVIMQDFDKLLAGQARSYQVILFIDENIGKVQSANADLMIEKLEYLQKNDIQYYTDLLFEDDWQGKLNTIFNRDINISDTFSR